jgi:hypothetical protein
MMEGRLLGKLEEDGKFYGWDEERKDMCRTSQGIKIFEMDKNPCFA